LRARSVPKSLGLGLAVIGLWTRDAQSFESVLKPVLGFLARLGLVLGHRKGLLGRGSDAQSVAQRGLSGQHDQRGEEAALSCSVGKANETRVGTCVAPLT
jgi:hypothetical protein